MLEKKKRVYQSHARDVQAIKTREQILTASKKLFQEEGFDQVTIQKIAELAEVAMPTIYAIFKSKRGVLQALMDEALPKEEFFALVESSMKESSAKKCLEITATFTRKMYDAEKEIMDIFRGAPVVSAELKELEQGREKRRYERQAEYVKKLIDEKLLPQGLTLQKARDILWSLTGRDLYRMLVIERGWSSDEYEKWLKEMLLKALINVLE